MDRLLPMLSGVFRVREEDLTDNATMESIPGWDSLTHMDLIVMLEKEYGIQLTGDEIADMRSVQAIREVLSRHGVK